MVSCSLKLSKEDMSVTQIAVSSPLCRLVTELLGNCESLAVICDGLREVTQQIVSVAQVTAGSALC